MRHLVTIVALTAFAHHSMRLHASAAAPPDDRIASIIRSLRTHEERVAGICLHYESQEFMSESSSACPAAEFGIDCWMPGTELLISLLGCPESEPLHLRASWDGNTSTWLRTRGDWSDSLLPPKDTTRAPIDAVTQSGRSAHLTDMSLPIKAGVMWAGRTWSEILSKSRNLQVAGATTVADQGCIYLTCEEGAEAGYSLLYRLSVMDGFPLIGQIEVFSDGRNLPAWLTAEELRDGRSIVRGDKTWFRCQYVTAFEIGNVDGSIPIVSKFRSGLDSFPNVFTDTIVDLTKSGVNDSGEIWLYYPATIADGTFVNNEDSGKGYFLGHDNDPFFAVQQTFLQHLDVLDHTLASVLRGLPEVSAAISQLGDNARAVIAFMLLTGVDMSRIVRLVKSLPRDQDQSEATMRNDLEAVCLKESIELTPINPQNSPIPSNQTMLAVDNRFSGRTRFQLVRLDDQDSVSVTRPGTVQYVQPLADWTSAAAGSRILYAPRWARPQAGTINSRFTLTLTIVAGLIVCLAMMYFFLRRSRSIAQ